MGSRCRVGSMMLWSSRKKSRCSASYELATGAYINAVCPISDAELEAYRKYPETFFGEVRWVPRQLKSYIDHCDFFYEANKDTSREKLLEFMADEPDHEQLATLSHKDLAIAYAERLAARA